MTSTAAAFLMYFVIAVTPSVQPQYVGPMTRKQCNDAALAIFKLGNGVSAYCVRADR